MSAPSRQERFDVGGPVDATVEIDAGRVDVPGPDAGTSDTGTTDSGTTPGELRVEVTADLEGAPGLGPRPRGPGGRRRRARAPLRVRPRGHPRPRRPPRGGPRGAGRARRGGRGDHPRGRPARRSAGPARSSCAPSRWHVTVHAPADGGVTVHAGAAPVDVTGRPGRSTSAPPARSPSSEVVARSSVRCGAGRRGDPRASRACCGSRAARATSRSHDVAAPVEVITGSGSVTADRRRRGPRRALRERRHAPSGTPRRATSTSPPGAGSVRVGVHAGVDASVDLRSAAGSASSDLPVTQHPPGGHARDGRRAAAHPRARRGRQRPGPGGRPGLRPGPRTDERPARHLRG